MRAYWVYILTSKSGVLYIGVTNNLERRVAEHKAKRIRGFTARYNVSLLMWNEMYRDVWQAIAVEKKIKGWSRARKQDLIRSKNPTWADLAEGWPGLPEKPRPTSATRGEPAASPTRDPSPSALDDRGEPVG